MSVLVLMIFLPRRPPSPIASPQPDTLSPPADASPSAQDVPTFNVDPPTPAVGYQPFKDYPENEEPELAPHEMLSNQQMLMNGKIWTQFLDQDRLTVCHQIKMRG